MSAIVDLLTPSAHGEVDLDLELVTDPETDLLDLGLAVDICQVAQHMRARFELFFGEWFLDQRAGVKWKELVFRKAPSEAEVETEIRRTILETPFVVGIRPGTFALDFDYRNRRLRILSFVAETEFGNLCVSSEPSISAPFFVLLFTHAGAIIPATLDG